MNIPPIGARFDAFEAIVQALLRNGGYVVVLLEAYFDESGSHEGAPVLCVAGFVFEKGQALKLSEEWSEVLNRYELPYFHMVDCAHGNGPFASLSRSQRILVAANIIGIIKRRAAIGFANSVDVEAYYELVPPNLRIAGSAYSFCVRNVLDHVGGWFHKIRFAGKSAYFFEAGHKSRSEADKVINDLFVNPLIEQVYRHGYVGHSFVLKKEAPPVQAADMLAWQWATDVRHEAEGKPRRKDFESLMHTGFSGHHFSRDRLPKYVDVLKRFEVDKDHDGESIEQTIARVMSMRKEWLPVLERAF